jgi:hypothetical protein
VNVRARSQPGRQALLKPTLTSRTLLLGHHRAAERQSTAT